MHLTESVGASVGALSKAPAKAASLAMDASGRAFLQNDIVTGEAFVEILRAGCYYLIQNAEELNRINVFPIPVRAACSCDRSVTS